MKEKNFRFGIVGTGAIASIHAVSIQHTTQAQLVGVYNRTYEKAKAFGEIHGCKVYDDLTAMLADENIDIITICTPSGAHLEIAEMVIRSGKHCLIEKPLEITVERCNRIIQLAEEYNVQVGTIFPTRFYPNSQKIKEQLRQGYFGDLVMGSASIKWHRSPAYYQSAAWRGTWQLDGGGALMNQGIHAVDMLLWYMGEAVFVQAISSNRLHHQIEVEDSIVANIKFKNGALGVIECTTAAFPGTPKRLEIVGTKGTVVLEEDKISFWEFHAQPQTSSIKPMTEGPLAQGGVNDPMAITHYGHQLQIQNFIEALVSNNIPLIDAVEGKKSVALICAIYESAKTGQRVYL
ncbi:Gfo/Idh/MocA family oxidoreductase [Sphingobacterium psychroaquaticum]|uniref:Gfo/Idh/MocA family protein n=1 Tax=Sphingobacterium psychroaquaticum TaxID=561061 RepID=UPI00106C0764|nr:Gfo/Idh/MocA family oxidoreductase [Sphingobacterium psychroaquaticum]QBQ42634.1 Gfo/Idh/MocA family oxidoreductase [Sphingobacterium psychroaquaticum]